jgi:hypothetical protein
MKRTTADLIKKLEDITRDPQMDTEEGHAAADRALVEFIDDPEVTRLYDALPKWYA